MLDDFRDILLEAYRFTNGNEVMQAIAAKQVGAKIDPSFFEQQGSIPTKLAFENFFKKCNQLGVKDTVYGVQILVSKCTRQNISQAVQNDGLYEFLRSYRKPWVKELQEYKDFSTNKFNPEIWHKFEKAVQAEQVNHGNVAKGSGNLKDVKEVYNDGTWRLLIPSSFEGAKAASYYIEDGKETPTEWCTRCDREYYNSYTEQGPLYIIRNMKTGKSYQMAFEDGSVDFLDQNDEKGDEITKGDLTKIPDSLLKLIKSPINNKTLLDYKNRPEEVVKKGMLSAYEAVGGGYGFERFSKLKFGKEIEVSNGIVKKEALNYTNDYIHNDRLSNYFNEKDTSVKKDKATKYYYKNKPEAWIMFRTSKKYGDKRVIDPGYDCNPRVGELLTRAEISQLRDVALKDYGWEKHSERAESKNDKSNTAEVANAKIDEAKNKIIAEINSILKNPEIREIVDVFRRGEGYGAETERILPTHVVFIDKNGHENIAEFRNSDGKVTYNYATKAWVYKGDEKLATIEGEQLDLLKKICSEYVKKLLKIPEVRNARQNVKEAEGHFETQSRKNTYEAAKNMGLSSKQAKRMSDDIARQNKLETLKHHKPFSSIQTEEVRYFNY